MAVDPRNFLLNTDYPLDKIIYMTSGSFTANVTFSGTYDISHSLGFAPLPIMQWSLTSDFEICYEISSSGTVGWESYGLSARVLSDNTELRISYYNNTGGNKTIYYRIIGFMPSNINVDVDPTAIAADNFVFNTDYNYLKLYMSGIMELNTTIGVSTSVTHNLGYIPRVFCWEELGTTESPLIVPMGGGVEYKPIKGEGNGTIVTTTQLTAVSPTGGYYQAEALHYRIYYDE